MVIGGCSPQLKALNVVPKPEIETVELESLEVVVSNSIHYTLAESLDAYLLDQSFNGVTLVASGDQIILLKAYELAL